MALVPDSIRKYTANLTIAIYKYASGRWHEAVDNALELIDAAFGADRARLTVIEAAVKSNGDLTLGGIRRSSWPQFNGDGDMVLSGSVELAGTEGVTVTHNLGHTNYQVLLQSLADGSRVGEVWYTRAANTLVVYNSGEPRLQASIMIFNDAGMTTPSAWRWTHPGELEVLGQVLLRNLAETQALRPDGDNTRNLGEADRRWAQGHFGAVYLGGVGKSAWPTATAGGNGAVVLSGAVVLAGADGVTITHNKGDANYLIKVLPTGSAPGRAGEISYIKAANTCTVYNSGEARLAADFELSAVA